MLNFDNFKPFRLALIAVCAAALSSCGGGGAGEASTPVTASTSNAPSNGHIEASVVDRDAAAENAAKLLYESTKGQAKTTSYHPTRVLARMVDTNESASISKQASKLSDLGLKQLSGQSHQNKLAVRKSSDVKTGGSSNMAVFEITDKRMSVDDAIAKLMRSGMVAYAEPDYNMHRALAPNDASYGLFWHLKNTGQSGGLAGNDIGAETAWNTTTGNGQVVVAVIDDGIKFDHPDLAPNMWSSAGSSRVTVASDITGASGVVDDANGANLAFERAVGDTSIFPFNQEASDHGTMVAGFVGSAGNNNLGGAGAAWNVKLMGIKIEGPAPNYGLSVSSFVNAIKYAVAKKTAGVNVRVINISYGLFEFSQALKDAMDEANAAGILVVVAAGNLGSNDQRFVAYPSSYKTPNLISVGALDRFNNRSGFSNYGPLVHLFAPGSEVPTTSSRASLASVTPGFIAPYYRYTQGTSFSSPIVAGAAALLWMQYPSETMMQIKARLLNSTRPFLTTADSMTAGKLDVGAAIQASVPCVPAIPTITEIAPLLVEKATHKVSVFVRKCASTGNVNISVNGVQTLINDDGVYPDEYANDGYYSGTFVGPAAGSNVSVSAQINDASSGVLSSTAKSLPTKLAASYVSSTLTFAGAFWDFPTFKVDYNNILGDYNNGSVAVVAPFPIKFDGRNVTNLYMSTNGYVCLDDPICVSSFVFPLPSGKDSKPFFTAQAIVAPWWADWTVACSSSDMYAEVSGSSPNRKVILTWKNMLPYSPGFNCATASSNGVSFQVVFYENQSYFDFKYNDVSTSVASGINPSGGLTGSAGVQLSGGKLGTQLFYKTATGVTSGAGYRFTPQSPSFPDVAETDFFATSVEGLRGSRITLGCYDGTAFCGEFGRKRPGDITIPVEEIKTTQIQMAAFLSRAINGHDLLADYTAYPASGFNDVVPNFIKYVNFVKLKGIMTGTGSSATAFCAGNCNNDFVTRAQMARYLVKAVRGGSFVPPAATGTFNDVSVSNPDAPYIEELARMKITNGTNIALGLYGPNDIVTRGQMATFLQRTFRPFDPH